MEANPRDYGAHFRFDAFCKQVLRNAARADLRTVRPPAKTWEPEQPESPTPDLSTLVEQLRKAPELASILAVLLASAPSGK